jgi:hypothetical protein
MIRLFVLTLAFFLVSKFSFSQSGKSAFFPEGYGMLYQREKVNFVSINTENKVVPLLKVLNRQFGSPIIAGEYIIYKYTNWRLSNKTIVVRISQAVQIDMDNRKSNVLFIYVETTDHEDLLDPKKVSSKELKRYFNKLFLDEVVNAPLDTFDDQ